MKQSELKESLYEKHISKQTEINKLKIIMGNLSVQNFESKNQINKLEYFSKLNAKEYGKTFNENFRLQDRVIYLEKQLIKAKDTTKSYEVQLKSYMNYSSMLFKIVIFLIIAFFIPPVLGIYLFL